MNDEQEGMVPIVIMAICVVGFFLMIALAYVARP